ncbi:MAG: hypothetical protein ACLS5R_03960 [Blautia sp.]
MKKRKLLLAAAAFSVFLAGGCQSHGEEAQPIKAMYIEKGEDFQIFVDTSTGVLFDASIPEGTEELTTGDLVEIYGDGIMLESYPGQYPGVSRIVVTKQGSEEDAKQYESLVMKFIRSDPSEPPYLNLEYRTKEAVWRSGGQGGYTWSYTDETVKTRGCRGCCVCSGVDTSTTYVCEKRRASLFFEGGEGRFGDPL